MSTTHYSGSQDAASSERYVRGMKDERAVAISGDAVGPLGVFSQRAGALARKHNREVEALHYRQSFSDQEFDPKDPEQVQRVNDMGYLLAKKMHPNAQCLVVTHTDGHGGKPHNHILVANHDDVTGKALSDYRTFYDRPEQGGQRGIKSANDELMREQGLSIAKEHQLAPNDWELCREDFAEGSPDRDMGDRFTQALHDPRSVDVDGLQEVIEEQNQQEDMPRMRLSSRKNKKTGKEQWTLHIGVEDERRKERRALTSRLSEDFTPEGAQAFFDYHHKQKEQEHERSTRQAEAAERAGRAAAAARQSGDDGGLDLDPRRRRGAEREARPVGRAAEEARGVREGHGRGDDEADVADHGPDLHALQRRVREDREYREQAERDREHARRVRAESQRRELELRVAELGRGGAEESRGYGLGD